MTTTTTTRATVTLHTHPADPNIVLVRSPADLNADMGRFQPARWDPETRAYLVHVDHLEALRTWAKHANAYLVDQRSSRGPRILMPECAHCGQPAPVDRQPVWCPNCGDRWQPTTDPQAESPGLTKPVCASCGTQQHPGFRWCSACGATMPKPKRREPVVKRETLADPMPLSEALDDLKADLSAKHTPQPEAETAA